MGFSGNRRQFQMEKYSSISSIIERTKGQILKDRNFKKRADRVANMVNKSQEQTLIHTNLSSPYGETGKLKGVYKSVP